MKQRIMLFSLFLIATLPLVAQGERLGDLNRDSIVLTPGDDIDAPSVTTKDGFPVFEIVVPDGWTEIQIRATTRNFAPGFLVKRNGSLVLNYVPTGVTVNGRKQYQALGTDDIAQWNGTKWTFGYDNLQSTSNVIDPWNCTSFTSTSGNAYALQKEYFVYRTCTTGAAADTTWGTGTSDADPWVFINKQSIATGEEPAAQAKWDKATSLTSQLQLGGTPGRSVLFQPSRGVLGAVEWMQQNHPSLVWVYSFEGVAGPDRHPDGQRKWNIMHPLEWRKARIQLTP
jgi:hypothetical protein